MKGRFIKLDVRKEEGGQVDPACHYQSGEPTDSVQNKQGQRIADKRIRIRLRILQKHKPFLHQNYAFGWGGGRGRDPETEQRSHEPRVHVHKLTPDDTVRTSASAHAIRSARFLDGPSGKSNTILCPRNISETKGSKGKNRRVWVNYRRRTSGNVTSAGQSSE